MRLPRTLNGKDVNSLDKRLKALTARPQMPKGAIPKNMRPPGRVPPDAGSLTLPWYAGAAVRGPARAPGPDHRRDARVSGQAGQVRGGSGQGGQRAGRGASAMTEPASRSCRPRRCSSMIRARTTRASSRPRSSARGIPIAPAVGPVEAAHPGDPHAGGLGEEAEEEAVLDDEHRHRGPAVADRVGEEARPPAGRAPSRSPGRRTGDRGSAGGRRDRRRAAPVPQADSSRWSRVVSTGPAAVRGGHRVPLPPDRPVTRWTGRAFLQSSKFGLITTNAAQSAPGIVRTDNPAGTERRR